MVGPLDAGGDEVYFKGISNEKTRMTSRFVMPDNVFSLQSASVQYDLNTLICKKNGESRICVFR